MIFAPLPLGAADVVEGGAGAVTLLGVVVVVSDAVVLFCAKAKPRNRKRGGRNLIAEKVSSLESVECCFA